MTAANFTEITSLSPFMSQVKYNQRRYWSSDRGT
jgi:hypothetical protein